MNKKQLERTRDYGMALSIFSNAVFSGEPITEDELEILEYIIDTERYGEITECVDCGCALTPLED